MLEWLVISKEKYDVQLITADFEMWGSTEFIDKVMAKEGKDVLLLMDNQVRIYIVVKQGCGTYKPDLEKLRQEFKSWKYKQLIRFSSWRLCGREI